MVKIVIGACVLWLAAISALSLFSLHAEKEIKTAGQSMLLDCAERHGVGVCLGTEQPK